MSEVEVEDLTAVDLKVLLDKVHPDTKVGNLHRLAFGDLKKFGHALVRGKKVRYVNQSREFKGGLRFSGIPELYEVEPDVPYWVLSLEDNEGVFVIPKEHLGRNDLPPILVKYDKESRKLISGMWTFRVDEVELANEHLSVSFKAK